MDDDYLKYINVYEEGDCFSWEEIEELNQEANKRGEKNNSEIEIIVEKDIEENNLKIVEYRKVEKQIDKKGTFFLIILEDSLNLKYIMNIQDKKNFDLIVENLPIGSLCKGYGEMYTTYKTETPDWNKATRYIQNLEINGVVITNEDIHPKKINYNVIIIPIAFILFIICAIIVSFIDSYNSNITGISFALIYILYFVIIIVTATKLNKKNKNAIKNIKNSD